MALRPIFPIRRRIDARVRVPASKSIANRELVLSATADGVSRLDLGPLDPGEDVAHMRQLIAGLGYGVEWDRTWRVIVRGEPSAPLAEQPLDAGDAGTVARFGAALAALQAGPVVLDGSEQLRRRPITPLFSALRKLGATIEGNALPANITGPLLGGEVDVPGGESSQFASALLLVAPRLREGLRLRITGPLVSAPFVDVTVASLEARGVTVERPSPREYVVHHQSVKARSLEIPGDVTAATYPAAAAAILGGSVTIDHVDARVRPGAQGDARFFDLLREMGCSVSHGRNSVAVRRSGPLYGITTDVRDCSDVFPTLAAIAAVAEGPTELMGIGHTRGQESDRIAAVAGGINALGGRAIEFGDAIRIEPVPLHDGVVDAHGDHRIAMAFSVLGLSVPGVAIEGSESVAKTFPEFYQVLRQLS